jgi:hypothetical protein
VEPSWDSFFHRDVCGQILKGANSADCRWNLDRDFRHQLIMRKRGSVSVLDVFKVHPAVKLQVLAPDLSRKRHQHCRPAATGISFGQ